MDIIASPWDQWGRYPGDGADYPIDCIGTQWLAGNPSSWIRAVGVVCSDFRINMDRQFQRKRKC